MALNETWILDSINFINLIDYDTVYNQGEVYKNDGVLVFLKSQLNYRVQIVSIGVIKCLRISISKKYNIII